jgi:HD-GYP domain-containing protein (c-di-GMP phosphodiesterase class II)
MKIVDFVVKTPEALDVLYEKAISRKATADGLFANSVNVSIYSLKIGMAMKFDQKKMLRLGIAGLAHDIGMAKVPGHIAGKTQKLFGDEFEMLKSHPKFGAEILKHLGSDYSWLVETVYQEHERENGKGYPQGLPGDRINEFARIIAVGDVYDALTSPRPHRKPFPPFEATKEIVQSQKEFYWPKAVKTLLDDFSAFPGPSPR